MSERSFPYVRFPGIQIAEELFPLIWTSNKLFSIDFVIPFSNGTSKVQTKLFGLPRSKANEMKYSKNLENDIEDQDLVEIEEETLSIPSSDYLSSVGLNCALFVLPNRIQCSLSFELSRNHWERAKNQKFMMFVLKVSVETFSCNIRIYAQKTTPSGFFQANVDALMYLLPITDRFVPRKRNIPITIEDQLTSPDSDSSSEEEKKGEKRRFRDDMFVIDTSPLPQELIRMWSNAEGLRLFMSALQPLMTTQSFCIPGECIKNNSFDVKFVEKRIRVE